MGSSTSSMETHLRSALAGVETVRLKSRSPASSSRLTPKDGGATSSESDLVDSWAATPAGETKRHRTSARATETGRPEALPRREPGKDIRPGFRSSRISPPRSPGAAQEGPRACSPGARPALAPSVTRGYEILYGL